jgi:hypothetical protein
MPAASPLIPPPMMISLGSFFIWFDLWNKDQKGRRKKNEVSQFRKDFGLISPEAIMENNFLKLTLNGVCRIDELPLIHFWMGAIF